MQQGDFDNPVEGVDAKAKAGENPTTNQAATDNDFISDEDINELFERLAKESQEAEVERKKYKERLSSYEEKARGGEIEFDVWEWAEIFLNQPPNYRSSSFELPSDDETPSYDEGTNKQEPGTQVESPKVSGGPQNDGGRTTR